MKTAITIIIATLLTGCATTISKQEAAVAHFDPLPADYQTEIRGLNMTRLKDPFSAVYVFGPPRRGFWQDGFAYGGKKHFGMVVQAAINARNSFGGYVGAEMHYYAFAGGQIFEITTLWTQEPKMAGYIE